MTIVVLFYAAASVLMVGALMVLFHAFQKHLSWAVGMVVLPVLYPIYSWRHWSESQPRNGFLISVAGALLVIVSLYGGAANFLPLSDAQKLAAKIPAATPGNMTLPNAAAAAQIQFAQEEIYDAINHGNELEQLNIDSLAPRLDIIINKDSLQAKKAYQTMNLQQASKYLELPARVTLLSGEIKQGRLFEITGSSLVLAQFIGNGEVSLEYMMENIQKLEVQSSIPAQTDENILDTSNAAVIQVTDAAVISNQAGELELPGDVIKQTIFGTESSIFPAIQDKDKSALQ